MYGIPSNHSYVILYQKHLDIKTGPHYVHQTYGWSSMHTHLPGTKKVAADALSRSTNLANFSLAPGYSDSQAFCLDADILATAHAPAHLLHFRLEWSATTMTTYKPFQTNERCCNPLFWSAQYKGLTRHSIMPPSPRPIFPPVCHHQRGIKPHHLTT
jgi:hypothetical protein